MSQAHSDYHNSDNPATPISGGVLVFEYWVDEAGYVLMGRKNADIRGTTRNPRHGEVTGNESGAAVIPFDRSEIVCPEPLWPMDKDGRGLSYLEVKGKAFLLTEQRVIARIAREWETSNPAHHAVVTRFAA